MFDAKVSGTGHYSEDVDWSVTGGGVGTSIDANGKLTVADNEATKTLTVKATAKGDKTKSAEATVTVKERSPALPTVTGVKVTPDKATVAKGKTQDFSATVSGTGDFDKTVTWSVEDGNDGTSIDANGKLTVADNETSDALTVIATANGNKTKFAEAEVTVVPAPTITSVTVTPATATVEQGNTQDFAATVTGTGDFDKSVKWSVIGGHEGTSIDNEGVLTVAKNETAKTLTVRAVANGDETKVAEATVTVKEAGNAPNNDNKPNNNKPAKEDKANPSTGDQAPIGMSIVLGLIAMAGLAGMGISRRRKDTF